MACGRQLRPDPFGANVQLAELPLKNLCILYHRHVHQCLFLHEEALNGSLRND
jgi:hypothetical protein